MIEEYIEKNILRQLFLCGQFYVNKEVNLEKLSNLLLKKADEPFKKISAAQNSNDKKIIRQAVAMTTITALIIACAAMFGISKLTGHYMKNVQNSIYLWEKNSAANNNGTVSSTDKYNYALEQLKENFESSPLVQYGLDYIGKIIKFIKTFRILGIDGGSKRLIFFLQNIILKKCVETTGRQCLFFFNR